MLCLSDTIHENSAFHPQDQSRQESPYTSSGDLQLVCFNHFAISGFPTKIDGHFLEESTKISLVLAHYSPFFFGKRTSSRKKDTALMFFVVFRSSFFVGTSHCRLFHITPPMFCSEPRVQMARMARGAGHPRLGNPRWIVTQLFWFNGNRSRPKAQGLDEKIQRGSPENECLTKMCLETWRCGSLAPFYKGIFDTLSSLAPFQTLAS